MLDMQQIGYYNFMEQQERKQLEEKAFNIAFGSMEYFGEEADLLEQIEKATTAELKAYIKAANK